MFYIRESEINHGIMNIFFEDCQGNRKMLNSNKYETYFSLFQRYVNETNKYYQNLDFIFNGKKLDPYINLG